MWYFSSISANHRISDTSPENAPRAALNWLTTLLSTCSVDSMCINSAARRLENTPSGTLGPTPSTATVVRLVGAPCSERSMAVRSKSARPTKQESSTSAVPHQHSSSSARQSVSLAVSCYAVYVPNRLNRTTTLGYFLIMNWKTAVESLTISVSRMATTFDGRGASHSTSMAPSDAPLPNSPTILSRSLLRVENRPCDANRNVLRSDSSTTCASNSSEYGHMRARSHSLIVAQPRNDTFLESTQTTR
jgi:hypothetical protein